ncbi:MAG: hypothetical protein EOR26_05070 [Mesorhizobium sp.]|uniref:hypothetical protein n=1 Tax=unclassified Mesorhizobium TaxID=325217 RepID=UPI000FCC9091|nr:MULTISPECIES: hypothetical protein [unclassified Mesorhizobium]RUV69651.1 hypothetical protein EOA78_22685 [Mesorhizobium sp. M5C.F.Cr.IN.023.01.1.1]RWI51071.1 MAG: hypothetical protein EOR15_06650 [Mesorhizobium sp.]RWI62059.1 MAG: hypothetical protein EOR16_03850 [Mesorhizobium sp.]RWJ13909.1 MAG: hypothetical protein EOR24_01105 [Mesorhizobium sp.]RWJ16865.1 MAG: hypothetical protein EOR25_13335 [Mesorhizobium sp.]
MTLPVPSFSPAMLRLFLHARCRHAHFSHLAEGSPSGARKSPAKRELDRLRKLAGITNNDMHSAWMGWLPTPETRVRVWAVFGHFPTDFGITLTHGGQDNG